MSNLASDDYWKESSLCRFNFEDDDKEDTQEINLGKENTESVFYTSLHNVTTLPIHSVVSKKGLDCILQDTKLPIKSNAPLIEETVKKLFLGISCVLDHYRTLDQKKELLSKACDTSDGNVILKVVLHLRKSLNDSTFHYHLSKYKLALTQYCNHLIQQNKYMELHALYMAIGSTNELINVFYLPARNYSSQKKTRDEIEKFFNILGSIVSNFNKVTLKNYQFFLDTLIKQNLSFEYPTEYLSSLYKRNLDNKASAQDISSFCSSLKIENFQQQWLHLNVLATMDMWDKLMQTYVKPNMFMKKIKCDVDLDIVVTALQKHDAPKHVIGQFLQCMGDSEKALYLGRKYQCRKFVIEKLIENRDRLGLIEYKKIVPSQSEDFFHIEKGLCSVRNGSSKHISESSKFEV